TSSVWNSVRIKRRGCEFVLCCAATCEAAIARLRQPAACPQPRMRRQGRGNEFRGLGHGGGCCLTPGGMVRAGGGTALDPPLRDGAGTSGDHAADRRGSLLGAVRAQPPALALRRA